MVETIEDVDPNRSEGTVEKICATDEEDELLELAKAEAVVEKIKPAVLPGSVMTEADVEDELSEPLGKLSLQELPKENTIELFIVDLSEESTIPTDLDKFPVIWPSTLPDFEPFSADVVALLVLCFRPEVALELPMVVADENSNLLESSEPKENKGKTLSPFCATVFSTNGVATVGVEGG